MFTFLTFAAGMIAGFCFGIGLINWLDDRPVADWDEPDEHEQHHC